MSPTRLLLLLAGVTLVALAAIAAAAPAAGSRASLGRWWADDWADDILFADFPGGGEEKELFVIRPDGSMRVQLTDSPDRPESQPCWSPSRAEVAYAVRMHDDPILGETWGIETLELSSRVTRTVSAGPLDVAPDWSPDGSQLAYVSIVGQGSAGQGSSISVVGSDGSAPRPLIELTGRSLLQSPDWSPDGTRIVFAAGYNDGGELYVMGSDGLGATLLYEHVGWDDIDPAWSPDGRYIAFASGFTDVVSHAARHDIWLLDLDTGRAGSIATHPSYDLQNPSWSPDGSRIVFHAEVAPPPDGRWELYSVPWSGGVLQELTTGVEPDWRGAGPAPTEDQSSTPATPTPIGPTATAPVTTTPPVPPTLPTLPTLPAFPTRPIDDRPTATMGPAPTFPAPGATATPTLAASASPPTPSATATSRAGAAAYLPYAAAGHALVPATPTPTPPACLEREIEPNDTKSQADERPLLCPDWIVAGRLGEGDPTDLYRFDLEDDGRIESDLLLSELPEGSDYDLLLYRDGLLDPIGESRNAGLDRETIALDLPADHYYLRVVAAIGSRRSDAPYRLYWFLPSAP